MSPPLASRSSGSTTRVSMFAKPCSSKVRDREAMTSRSTTRAAGSSSGNPLSGVGLAMSTVLEAQWDQVRVGGALPADRRLLPVAGKHDDVVGEGQHLAPQALQ